MYYIDLIRCLIGRFLKNISDYHIIYNKDVRSIDKRKPRICFNNFLYVITRPANFIADRIAPVTIGTDPYMLRLSKEVPDKVNKDIDISIGIKEIGQISISEETRREVSKCARIEPGTKPSVMDKKTRGETELKINHPKSADKIGLNKD